MEEALLLACKNLHFSVNLIAMAKKIKAKDNLSFLLELFLAELSERDRKRRNAYMNAAKFDVIKTYENYSFSDIKLPVSLSVDDIIAV
jgi:hypothetical protein